MSARRATVALAFGADPIVVAYGMGVDSIAMLIGLRDRTSANPRTIKILS
jgi:hypothetical protein